METRRTLNVYCDESCHVEHDGIPVMVWGAVWCPIELTKGIAEQLRALKRRHGLSSTFEIKWTKVSPGKLEFYADLIEFFISDPRMSFRGLVVPDKSKIDHERFGQTHNDWYYKMYFNMLKYIITPSNQYRIYLDVKDTKGGPKTRELHEVLCNNIHDFNHKTIQRVEQIRSHESELLQLADLLIGAVGYANRGLDTSPAKTALIGALRARLGSRALNHSSAFSATKFNLLIWSARETGA
jgi:hypothetical protein